MDKSTTPDESPKRKVAKGVVSEKHSYFVPAHGVSVEAHSAQEAASIAARSADKQAKDGDA